MVVTIQRSHDAPGPGPALMGIILFLCLIGSTAAQETGDAGSEGQTDGQPRQLTAHLYFADKMGRFLTAEERTLDHPGITEGYGKNIIQGLIGGPERGLMRTIPAETGLRALFVSEQGTAFVDLTREVKIGHCGGVTMERLTVYAIVNSLILNAPEIKAVKILIDGQESPTLAGHMDLRFPFKAEMRLIR